VLNHQNNVELNIWQLYLYSLKSSQTRKKYQGRIDKFFSFAGVEGKTTEEKSIKFVEKAGLEGKKWVFNSVLNFMLYQVNRVQNKEIVASTIQNYLKSIKLFCELADIEISWKRISRGLPRGKSYADDRIPTDEEIQKIIEYPDRRIKAIIYTMISSGIRLGSWDYLRWGNITSIEKDGLGVVAAKVIVYAGEDEEYFTFISSEAYLELQKWIKYREDSGEIIDENSWVMRDLWDSGSLKDGKGLVSKPKKLASSGIKRLIERAIWAQGLRNKLEHGKKRHPFSAVHSFRKWFKTRSEVAGMKPINVEKLISHSIGISNSYYRPTENEILED
jgi:integrase